MSRSKIALMIPIVLLATLALTVGAAGAQEQATAAPDINKGLVAISAGIAIAITGFAAAIGLSWAISSIAAAGAERPEIIGKFFVYLVFVEAIAIYGLIIAFMIILFLGGA